MKKHKKHKDRSDRIDRNKEPIDRKHKVKVIYKYAAEEDKGGKIYVDRPRRTEPDPLLIKGEAFCKEYATLCAKYLSGIKKKDRTLAMCQIEDRSHIFIEEVKPRVLKLLGWDMK